MEKHIFHKMDEEYVLEEKVRSVSFISGMKDMILKKGGETYSS